MPTSKSSSTRGTPRVPAKPTRTERPLTLTHARTRRELANIRQGREDLVNTATPDDTSIRSDVV